MREGRDRDIEEREKETFICVVLIQHGWQLMDNLAS